MADTTSAAAHGEIVAVKYSEALRTQWEDFVAQSFQGTLFHTRAFLAYHPPARFHDASLLFFKKEKLLAVLPAAITAHETTRELTSHPGASFGGLVFHAALTLSEHFAILAACRNFAHAQGCRAVTLTLAPAFYQREAQQTFEYALWQAGFRAHRRELTQAVRLDTQRTRHYSAEFHRKVRRAQSLGVVVQESADFANFYTILQRNLAERHGAQPAHTLAELLDLQQRLPGRVRLFAAIAQEQMIAGYVLFVCNQEAALAFYIAQLYEAQHYRAINLLAHEVMNWCEREGLAYFDFGTSTINGEPNWGLLNFREAAGARGFWREKLRLELRESQ